eukprot:gene47304-biopygen7982
MVSISSNPVTPGPVLLVPQTISSCSNLTVDATLSTGSGGRYWSAVAWTVTAYTGDSLTADTQVFPDAMVAKLQSYGQNINKLINIQTYMLQEATYSITLSLTNFLGQTSSVSTIFVVNGNKNLPTLSIIGSSLVSVNPSQQVILYSTAVLSACSTSKSIVYSWNVFVAGGVSSGIVSTSADPKVLIIPAYKLTAGTVYQAQVTATVTDNGVSAVATSQATIQVGNGP